MNEKRFDRRTLRRLPLLEMRKPATKPQRPHIVVTSLAAELRKRLGITK